MGTVIEIATATVRAGFVDTVDAEAASVRVRLPDLDDLVSGHLQVLMRKAKGDRDYWLPDPDDEVWCLFMGNGIETGIVLGSTYTLLDPPPVADKDKRHVVFADGTWFEYDRNEHKLTIHAEASADAYVRDALTVVCDSDVSLSAKGNISMRADGNIDIAAGGNVTINGRVINLN